MVQPASSFRSCTALAAIFSATIIFIGFMNDWVNECVRHPEGRQRARVFISVRVGRRDLVLLRTLCKLLLTRRNRALRRLRIYLLRSSQTGPQLHLASN